MKHSPKDFDFLKYIGLLQAESAEEAPEFFFDDEPLKRILYGEDTDRPTRANFFLPAIEFVQKIFQAYKDGNIQETLTSMHELGIRGYPMTIELCFELAVIIKGIMPHYPNPLLSFDLLALHPLIEQMWDLALEKKDKRLQETVGTSLYRWYEHQKRFAHARHVLTTLIEIDREKGDRIDEATLINNFAFEYLLDGRCRDAISGFEQAAEGFKEIGDLFNHANSQANYWICKFECGDLEDIEKIETEVKGFQEILCKGGSWQRRNPFILLAKIEERRGNIKEAIYLVEQAITSAKDSPTRYPELDRKYLEDMKKRLDLGSK